jgi:hypothetical protein
MGQPDEPLNLTLKGTGHGLPYWARRGIDKETAETHRPPRRKRERRVDRRCRPFG